MISHRKSGQAGVYPLTWLVLIWMKVVLTLLIQHYSEEFISASPKMDIMRSQLLGSHHIIGIIFSGFEPTSHLYAYKCFRCTFTFNFSKNIKVANRGFDPLHHIMIWCSLHDGSWLHIILQRIRHLFNYTCKNKKSYTNIQIFFVPPTGFQPVTDAVEKRCSNAVELWGHFLL